MAAPFLVLVSVYEIPCTAVVVVAARMSMPMTRSNHDNSGSLAMSAAMGSSVYPMIGALTDNSGMTASRD